MSKRPYNDSLWLANMPFWTGKPTMGFVSEVLQPRVTEKSEFLITLEARQREVEETKAQAEAAAKAARQAEIDSFLRQTQDVEAEFDIPQRSRPSNVRSIKREK